MTENARYGVKFLIFIISCIALLYGDDDLLKKHKFRFVFNSNTVIEHKNITNIEISQRKHDEFFYTFTLDDYGKKRLDEATAKRNLYKTMDIYIDEKIVSQPYIQENIKDGVVQVSGLGIIGNNKEVIAYTDIEKQASDDRFKITLGENSTLEDIAKCDRFIEKYKNADSIRIQEDILDAYWDKALITHMIKPKEEAIETYNEVIKAFEQSNLYYASELNSKAMLQKAYLLDELDR